MMRLRTLGDSAIEVGSLRVGPESEVLFGLLVFLAMQEGRPVPRARVRSLFWPDAPEVKASHSLRQLLYRVRQLGVGVSTTQSHVVLDPAALIADFVRLESPESSTDASAALGDAVGPFLVGYVPRFSEPFAAWIDEQRAVIHARVRRAMLGRVARSRAGGDWPAVARFARGILSIDPLNEEATLSLAEATALAGGKVEAVAMLDRYVEEIGSERALTLSLPPTLLRRRIAEPASALPDRRILDGAFVGRADSMAFLHRALQRTIAGRGESCFIWGPAGIGKTRLIDELVRGARLLGVRTERIACHPSDRQRPMSVFSALAQRLIDLPGALGCAPGSYDLLRRLCAPDTTSASLSAAVSSAGGLAARIRQSLYDVLDAIASEQCLLIVIEDVHWSDEQSALLLGEMAAWARERRLAFVLTSRTDRSPLAVEVGSHALPPLDGSAIQALAGSLLPDLDLSALDLLDRWVGYSEGNPLYLRELVAHWRVSGDANSIPPSLSALLRQRVAGLSETASVTLRGIAVLGRNCTVDRLLDLLQYPHHDLISALGELEREGLIGGDRDSLVCSHDMIARASTEMLTPLAFRMLHRLAAQTLEEETRPSAAAHMIWDCARHWDLAGDASRGLALSIECSRQLMELGLPHEAANLLTAARPLAVNSEQLGALLSALAHALHSEGRWRELCKVLQERRAINPLHQFVHDDHELLLVEAAWRGHNGDNAGLLDSAMVCAQAEDASSSHKIRAASQGIRLAAECCDRDRAAQLYGAIAYLLGDTSVPADRRMEIDTVYHTNFGDLDRGVEAARHLVADARYANDPEHLARALRFASFPYRLAGQRIDAEVALVEAFDVAKANHLRTAQTQAAYRLAVHFMALGRPATTLEWCQVTTSLASREEDPFGRSYVALLTVQAFLSLGDISAAQSTYASIAGFCVLNDLSRGANEFAAAKVRMQLEGRSGDVATEDVRRLLKLHLRVRDMGGDDFAAGTLFHALRRTGEPEFAIALFEEYVGTHRRDRLPFENELATFARLVVSQRAVRSAVSV